MFFITCPACKANNLNTNFLKKNKHGHEFISYKEYKLSIMFNCKNCDEKIALLNHIRKKDEKVVWVNLEKQKQINLEKMKIINLEIKNKKNNKKTIANLEKKKSYLEHEILHLKYKMKASISVKTKVNSLNRASYL